MNLYNHDRKMAFIYDYSGPSISEFAAVVFGRTARYERDYRRDLCEMDAEQLQYVFDRVGGLVIKYQRSVRALFAAYADWCVAHQYCSSNTVSSILLVSLDKVRRAMVANATHLREVLDLVYPGPDVITVQRIYRSIFWLAFMGFSWLELPDLLVSEVDLTQMRIVHRRKDGYIPGVIPAEAAPDIYAACTMTTLSYDRGRYIAEKERAPGDWLIRTLSPMEFATEKEKEEYIRHSFRPSLSRAFKMAKADLEERGVLFDWVSIDLTYDSAFRSGIFSRHFDMERAGLPVSLANIYAINYQGDPNQKNDFNTFRYNYQQNYAQWREAFGAMK